LPRVDVSSEIVISAPIEMVAEFASNPDNAPAWYENIKSVQWVTTPSVRPGSKVAFVAQFLGRTLSYIYEFTAVEPGRRLVMQTSEGPFPMETTYEWIPEGPTATRMKLRNRGSPTGFAVLAAPLMSWAMRRENRKDLARLKKILETS
jgi:uncharacterized membrane protein